MAVVSAVILTVKTASELGLEKEKATQESDAYLKRMAHEQREWRMSKVLTLSAVKRGTDFMIFESINFF